MYKRQRDATILEVLYGCGLRVSELVNLDRANILSEEGFLRVFGKEMCIRDRRQDLSRCRLT